MVKIFAISDLHLFHDNILKFMNGDQKLRPFSTIDEMHHTIASNWQSTVSHQDHVYVVGDISFRPAGISFLKGLNGHKRLILGNHDKFKMDEYYKVFERIHGAHQVNGVWFTHIPMHLGSVETPRVKVNIHGHLHANKIDHPKYMNVCVECVNYTPVDITHLIKSPN